MMNMKHTIKRMVLTGAAVTVMMSLAAPAAIAQEVRDHRDGSGGILCDFFSFTCDDPPPYNVSDPVVPPPVVNPPDPVEDTPPKHCEKRPQLCDVPFDEIPVLENPVVTEPPKHCVLRPKLCGEDPFGENPFGENPVIENPEEDENPVDTEPPESEEEPVSEPPDKDEQPTTGGGSGGGSGGGNSSGGSGGTGGGSSGPVTGGGSSGGSVSSASQTIDRGGNFVSSVLPHTLTTKIGDAGSAVKKNLPAPVAKSLPNTGGGWSFLVLVGGALIAGGLAITTIVRRKTSVTSNAG